MAQRIETDCDMNSECKGGKSMFKCNAEHDICSCCYIKLSELAVDKELQEVIEDDEEKLTYQQILQQRFCPICIKNAKLV